jgi:hypothetical protein
MITQGREQKPSSHNIAQALGFSSIDDLAVWLDEYGDSDAESTVIHNIHPRDFTSLAFPEFSSEIAMLSESSIDLLREYTHDFTAAYELTYRHHYEMQDEWLEIIMDPEIECYTYPGMKPVAAADVAARPHKYMSLEHFEQAMLCVADDGYWRANAREMSEHLWVESTWIGRWRRRLGRPMVAGVDDDPLTHSLIWRDNWKAVRDELAALNAQHYPSDDDEYMGENVNKYLSRGNSMEAAVVGLADRLAREAGWAEEPWGKRKKCPGYWSMASLETARQIGDLAGGPWQSFIEERSGRKARLRGMWTFAGYF